MKENSQFNFITWHLFSNDHIQRKQCFQSKVKKKIAKTDFFPKSQLPKICFGCQYPVREDSLMSLALPSPRQSFPKSLDRLHIIDLNQDPIPWPWQLQISKSPPPVFSVSRLTSTRNARPEKKQHKIVEKLECVSIVRPAERKNIDPVIEVWLVHGPTTEF